MYIRMYKSKLLKGIHSLKDLSSSQMYLILPFVVVVLRIKAVKLIALTVIIITSGQQKKIWSLEAKDNAMYL